MGWGDILDAASSLVGAYSSYKEGSDKRDAAKAEANIHSGHGLVRGRSPVPGSPGPLIFDTRDTATPSVAPAGDLFAGQKGAAQ